MRILRIYACYLEHCNGEIRAVILRCYYMPNASGLTAIINTQ